MISAIKHRIQQLPSWVFWTAMALISLFIMIFNDLFGESEPFQIFGLCFFLFLGISVVRWMFRQIKSVITLKRDKAKMEMLHLKSQVNPHFFFNTLNNLYGLVEKDPKEAQALILKLSDLMRYSIYEGQHEWVSLAKEITFLQNYVALHKNRYHKEVNITFKIDIDDQDYKIMPLMLILLVENAFKHGVEKLRNNAYVNINLIANDGRIKFDITNNFDPDEVGDQSSGIGISNLKRRLEIGYKKKFDLSISKTKETFRAQLSFLKV